MIPRRTRTEVLVQSDPHVVLELAELVERETEVVETVTPHQGLVMCQVRESARNSRFYLGEVLVTECRVRIGDEEGLGVLVGDDAARARALAVIDAAYAQKEGLSCIAELERVIVGAQESLTLRRRTEDARTYVSRVEFNEMSGQDMSVQAVVK